MGDGDVERLHLVSGLVDEEPGNLRLSMSRDANLPSNKNCPIYFICVREERADSRLQRAQMSSVPERFYSPHR